MITISKNNLIQFKNFAIVGLVSTGVNYGLFFLMLHLLGVGYILASALGFIVGIFVSYGLNSIYTFESHTENKKKEFSGYAAICIFSLILSLCALWFFVEILGINPLIGNILAIGVSTFSNFFGLKLFLY